MSKRPRTLDSFFIPPPTKKLRAVESDGRTSAANGETVNASNRGTYPFPIPHLPLDITETLNFAPSEEGRIINDQPDLDLVYYQPYIPKDIERRLFEFLRGELFFYRVKYTIKRGTFETQINTPRYTSVFGVDETSRFNDNGELVDATSGKPLAKDAYSCKPRPIPQCLDLLRSHSVRSETSCSGIRKLQLVIHQKSNL